MDKQDILSRLDIRAYYAGELSTLKANGNNQAQALCPFHEDKNPSLSINLETGDFHCFGCDKKGSVFDFYMVRHEVDFKAALEALAREERLASESKAIKAEYDYKDEAENLLFQTVRYEPKDFKQRRPDGKGGWIWSIKEGVRIVPFNLPEVLKAKSVIICEGEKDCLNLKALGLTATCNPMGAGKWRPEYNEHFNGKRVAILPDNDEPGRKHAHQVAQALNGIAESIKVVELPGLPVKGDVSDWIAQGGTKAALADLIKQASAWESGKEDMPGLVFLNTVKPEPVKWLWPARIALGKITIIDGDPGLGKSSIGLDLIARITTGRPMPDGTPCPQGGAVLIALEDGLADTLRPRLEALGADLSKVASLQTVPDDEAKPRFPTVEDIDEIRAACVRAQARILLIDPLMAHLDGKTNSYRDQDIRRALTPLAKLAEELEMAVIVIRHFTKGEGGKAVHKGGGSIGIIGQARSAFLVAKDPGDESLRIFACIKNNLAAEPAALSYWLKEVVINSEGRDIVTSKIEWGGTSTHTADTLLAIPADPEEKSALDEAKDFLTETLTGGPMAYQDIQKQARKAGIADATLRRAKKALEVAVIKQGYQGAWAWSLSKDAQENPKVLIKKDEHLSESLNTFDRENPETGAGEHGETEVIDLTHAESIE
ncbi:MAG: AAA family ATPase [Nitrospiraceae bacterium]|nr:AAA family ATPase [Nitrospiraceae bacterium]